MTELRPFGRTGVKVSPLTLGAMNFGSRANADHADGIRIIHRALDEGINIVDTADVYSQGESEIIVGKALAGRRDDVFLASKFHMQIGEHPNHRGNSRRWIIREVEASLTRLQTEWIDLYQVHRPDPDTDFDETLGALSDLVHQGKIRYIGTSTFPASAIVEGQWIAQRRGRERVVAEQPPYSILTRGIEREVLPVAQQYGLAVLPWSPLGGGWLSGRYSRELTAPISSRASRMPERYDPTTPANASKLVAVEQLAALADEAGISLIHLALAFVLQHPAVTSAIIGPRTLEHLESQLGAVKVTLSPEILDRIDEIVPPGVTLNPADAGYHPLSVRDAAYRRR
ncbi:aryl-alcohol dehydrogenase-like predicted oxidoreductase [Allocatelliglobosispora scoriae]|uniref:Aryl-alcohol dehydrogenase-like predicted oxidoreductase n=1 Tax=Allocatelliglobosispora scoriae TaxID=643052 RepID=A0A841BL58_9ACTN|nr:aldo/keto reductase [Allocatelliglobosispora scoriae]MBB5869024.1 aryl-alcohol dehydrogenase-like predicted oxidoreductase [Allocatelliglobosispora scoriae]